MPSATLKRRRTEEALRAKSTKKARKSKHRSEYNSSSEDEDTTHDPDFTPVNLQDSDDEVVDRPPSSEANPKATRDSKTPKDEGNADNGTDEDTLDEFSVSESETSTNGPPKVRKRNDPDAFATSMAKILGSKLSSAKRVDPVLSRSKAASAVVKERAETKLEAKARHKLKEEKRTAREKGHVKDVLGLESVDTSTAEIMEQERRLKKTAQKGVIKLFNAVMAAQVKAEEAAREAKKAGVIGIDKRGERATEESKKAFLDLIAGGGKREALPSA